MKIKILNIILDFDKVDSISSSFADELIAKIMMEVGQEKSINHVRIRNKKYQMIL